MDYQIHPNFRTETTTRNDIALLERDLITGIHVLQYIYHSSRPRLSSQIVLPIIQGIQDRQGFVPGSNLKDSLEPHNPQIYTQWSINKQSYPSLYNFCDELRGLVMIKSQKSVLMDLLNVQILYIQPVSLMVVILMSTLIMRLMPTQLPKLITAGSSDGDSLEPNHQTNR